MPSAGLSLQCANIFWTPAYRLVEYQCALCLESFLDHCECLVHLKICPKNGTNIFENFPEPGEFVKTTEPEESEDLVVAKDETEELDIWPAEEYVDSDEFEYEYVPEFIDINERKDPNAIVDEPKTNEHNALDISSASFLKQNTNHRMTSAKIRKLQSEDAEAFFKELLCTKAYLECEVCSKMFNKKDKLYSHIIRCHVRQFSCEICGKIFRDRSNLTVHLRTHTGERPYPCKICGKCFGMSNSLKKHMRIHSGERPYKCTMCPQAFIEKTRLYQHVEIYHTDKRKTYSCEICQKSYFYKSALKNHKRTHTGERPFECKVCGRKFSRKQSHSMHMNTHTGNKPYNCKICERCFHSSAARFLHEQSVHKMRDLEYV